jgi:CYTH domain-containing protein
MTIEIERKFLLKSIPNKKPSETIEIFQWYFKNDSGVWERARSCYSDIRGFYFVHTIKKSISPGINEEDEKEITSEQFNEFVNRCKLGQSRYISKQRQVFIDGELKWEVDVFNNGHYLIIAEVELPAIDYPITLPKFISETLLLEVTGMKQFGNKNLSNKFIIHTKKNYEQQT